ncbi:hypothetical protein PVAP13_8NG002301 [Panicum virgatum]|uniref:Uncharacterized protein n=1 Tax=Panicum virgatum TaxID=38727 RepID=A0A8T0P1I7_PANVG|nr:hypothetical protein PVAP13_8NG002301 [Panicum virgatum]
MPLRAALCIAEWRSNRTGKGRVILLLEERGEVKTNRLSSKAYEPVGPGELLQRHGARLVLPPARPHDPARSFLQPHDLDRLLPFLLLGISALARALTSSHPQGSRRPVWRQCAAGAARRTWSYSAGRRSLHSGGGRSSSGRLSSALAGGSSFPRRPVLLPPPSLSRPTEEHRGGWIRRRRRVDPGAAGRSSGGGASMWGRAEASAAPSSSPAARPPSPLRRAWPPPRRFTFAGHYRRPPCSFPFPCAVAWQAGVASSAATASSARRPSRRCLLDLLMLSRANLGVEDLEVMVWRSDGLLLWLCLPSLPS